MFIPLLGIIVINTILFVWTAVNVSSRERQEEQCRKTVGDTQLTVVSRRVSTFAIILIVVFQTTLLCCTCNLRILYCTNETEKYETGTNGKWNAANK